MKNLTISQTYSKEVLEETLAYLTVHFTNLVNYDLNKHTTIEIKRYDNKSYFFALAPLIQKQSIIPNLELLKEELVNNNRFVQSFNKAKTLYKQTTAALGDASEKKKAQLRKKLHEDITFNCFGEKIPFQLAKMMDYAEVNDIKSFNEDKRVKNFINHLIKEYSRLFSFQKLIKNHLTSITKVKEIQHSAYKFGQIFSLEKHMGEELRMELMPKQRNELAHIKHLLDHVRVVLPSGEKTPLSTLLYLTFEKKTLLDLATHTPIKDSFSLVLPFEDYYLTLYTF